MRGKGQTLTLLSFTQLYSALLSFPAQVPNSLHAPTADAYFTQLYSALLSFAQLSAPTAPGKPLDVYR